MIELRATIPSTLADPLEELFLEQVRSSWMLQQIKLGDPYTLSGFFETEEEGRAAWAELHALVPELPAPELLPVIDADWKEAYKEHFHPWSAGGLHWVPAWKRDEYQVPPGEAALYLDPGLAFGTGNHETTRLCALRLMECVAQWGDTRRARRVVDAGCGSGILALSAAKLGIGDVFGFDNDPEAVHVAQENAAVNGLGRPLSHDTVIEIAVFDQSLEWRECGLAEGLAGAPADLLLANIQADVLRLYAGELLRAVRPGGVLCLSGILAHEVEAVRAFFEGAAIGAWGGPAHDVEHTVLGEWSRVTLWRAASAG